MSHIFPKLNYKCLLQFRYVHLLLMRYNKKYLLQFQKKISTYLHHRYHAFPIKSQLFVYIWLMMLAYTCYDLWNIPIKKNSENDFQIYYNQPPLLEGSKKCWKKQHNATDDEELKSRQQQHLQQYFFIKAAARRLLSK